MAFYYFISPKVGNYLNEAHQQKSQFQIKPASYRVFNVMITSRNGTRYFLTPFKHMQNMKPKTIIFRGMWIEKSPLK